MKWLKWYHIAMIIFFVWIGWGCGNKGTLANDIGQNIRDAQYGISGY